MMDTRDTDKVWVSHPGLGDGSLANEPGGVWTSREVLRELHRKGYIRRTDDGGFVLTQAAHDYYDGKVQ